MFLRRASHQGPSQCLIILSLKTRFCPTRPNSAQLCPTRPNSAQLGPIPRSYPDGELSSGVVVLFFEANAMSAWLLENAGKKFGCDGIGNGKNGPKAARRINGSIGNGGRASGDPNGKVG